MIEASNLTKYYGSHPAITDLSFTIGEGEIVGFLGLNGAGKSTTLRIISCLLVPTSGTVKVDGFNVLEHSEEIRRRIGYLPEVPPLYQEMTVRAFLEFAAQLKGVGRSAVKGRVEEVEEITGVREVAQQVIGTLSAGYRQRVGIAQAVVHRPALLILDEPFAGLDPVQTRDMREMIRGLAGDHTVLLSSHLLSQIHETCDRILVIQQGTIVAQGREEELVQLLTSGAEVTVEAQGALEDVVAAIESIEGIADYETHPLDERLTRAVVRVAAGARSWTRRRPERSLSRPEQEERVDHDDMREALAAAFFEHGVGLREMRRSVAELENVFIQLTQGAGGAAAVKPAAKTASERLAAKKQEAAPS